MPRSEWLHAKSLVRGGSGLITARHPVAADVGLGVLRSGGNAIDGAVATILATGVVQPFATTIGGGGLLTAVAASGTAYCLDYRSEAPAGVTPDFYGAIRVASGLYGWTGVPGQANELGHRSIAVPGTIPGLAAAHHELGRMPWTEVLAPAITLAEEGFEQDWFGSLMQGAYLDRLLNCETTARTFLRDHRYPHRPRMIGPGDVFRQPALAATLREIAEYGLSGYLEGSAGHTLVNDMSEHEGAITAADLAAYRPRRAAPHTVPFRDHTVVGPAHGGLYGLLFAVLDRLDLGHHEPLSPARLHLVAEAVRRCRRVEAVHAGDGRSSLWIDHPELVEDVVASISPARRTDGWLDFWWARGPTAAEAGQEQTAHVCAVDSDGMMVSLTETILGAFGSAVTTSAEMLMNNSMFAFVPMPGYPNSVAAGHRPQSNMTPIVVQNSTGKPVMTVGASGGQRISAAVVQIVAYLLDHGMAAQEAIASPRLDVLGDTVLLDRRIPESTVAKLVEIGHEVQRAEEDLSTLYFANPAAVVLGDDNILNAGVNPLHLTSAAGW